LVADPSGIVSAADAETAVELGGAGREASPQTLAAITALVRDRRVDPHVTQTHPLVWAAEALAAVEAGHSRGKRVIIPCPAPDPPRRAAVTSSEDGRVVAAIQEADEPGARLVSSLWELDPHGVEPARRLTFSEKGESSPRFAPDGSLLFSSARPDPEGGAEED